MKKPSEKKLRPAITQDEQPGKEYKMKPKPEFNGNNIHFSEKLKNKVALITGGDSGIGRAISLAFAKEGCNVCIIYLNEDKDANETNKLIEETGRQCLLIRGDITDEKFCKDSVKKIHKYFKRLDILVNNAAVQFPEDSITKITKKKLFKTFETNIFSNFYLVKSSLKYLTKGACIINTASVTAYRGSDHLIDYSSTKGAIVSFTRSLAMSLVKKGIRVNAVAPGPVWTPLIPATFKPKYVSTFGSDVPMGRAAEPDEIAPCYVFLASTDSAFMTGQTLHPNGGEIING
jgi:NAD(P)-dependent dehydrogenase (short-subunit alcohol dehydrogenase family)